MTIGLAPFWRPYHPDEMTMMRQRYVAKDFRQGSIELIEVMNRIITEYQRQGFVLTVRQLYYQLVARDIIPNNLREYKRAASIMNDAKLAGYIDWDAIEDRTRAFVSKQRWENGAHILRAAKSSFHKDMWRDQAARCFVIVEKEALVGVLQGVCEAFDMPLLAARGYPSGTVLREFAVEQIIPAMNNGQTITVFHLGDHDPSGLDMSRDLRERLSLFTRNDVEVHRLALNMDQVEAENPPENPAKVTDSRFEKYAAEFGQSSWELDALSPRYLADLVTRAVEPFIDMRAWNVIENEISDTKDRIEAVSADFDE